VLEAEIEILAQDGARLSPNRVRAQPIPKMAPDDRMPFPYTWFTDYYLIIQIDLRNEEPRKMPLKDLLND
jgi:hypothetical protein